MTWVRALPGSANTEKLAYPFIWIRKANVSFHRQHQVIIRSQRLQRQLVSPFEWIVDQIIAQCIKCKTFNQLERPLSVADRANHGIPTAANWSQVEDALLKREVAKHQQEDIVWQIVEVCSGNVWCGLMEWAHPFAR